MGPTGRTTIRSIPSRASEPLAEPPGIGKDFRAFSQRSSRSPKVWADSYLTVFAVVAGVKLVTFDRALRAGRAEVLVL
jgi:hypothetical protein